MTISFELLMLDGNVGYILNKGDNPYRIKQVLYLYHYFENFPIGNTLALPVPISRELGSVGKKPTHHDTQ